MFGNKIIEGNKQNFLRTKNSIVLTQSLARKIFGRTPAVGKQLMVNRGDSANTYYAVSNVIADMPKNSHLLPALFCIKTGAPENPPSPRLTLESLI